MRKISLNSTRELTIPDNIQIDDEIKNKLEAKNKEMSEELVRYCEELIKQQNPDEDYERAMGVI